MMERLDTVKERLRAIGPLSGFEMTRAVAATCYMMAAADGEVSPEERSRMGKTLAAFTESAESRREIPSLIESIAAELTARGQDGFLRDLAAKIRQPAQRRAAFSYAVGVAWADGRLDYAEKILLIHLGDAFGIDDTEAERIIDQLCDAPN